MLFGFRGDGKKIKSMKPVLKMIPYIMSARHDSQNLYTDTIKCKYLDNFIEKVKSEQGVEFTYFHIMLAAAVRVNALRPGINRFVMNGRIFKRNNIQMSFAILKDMRDDTSETTIKLTFDGTEDLLTVKQMMDDAIALNQKSETANNTDKTARSLTSNAYKARFIVGMLKRLDKHGLLPKSVWHASPFHCSTFITNMKSLGIHHIHHHLYDFGTCGVFVAMGKERLAPVVNEDGAIVAEKLMDVGYVLDERICNGLYYAKCIKLINKILSEPDMLMTKLDKKVEDIR